MTLGHLSIRLFQRCVRSFVLEQSIRVTWEFISKRIIVNWSTSKRRRRTCRAPKSNIYTVEKSSNHSRAGAWKKLIERNFYRRTMRLRSAGGNKNHSRIKDRSSAISRVPSYRAASEDRYRGRKIASHSLFIFLSFSFPFFLLFYRPRGRQRGLGKSRAAALDRISRVISPEIKLSRF